MREIDFAELRGDPAVEGDQVRLAGRCYHGPIRLGDTFTEAASGDDRHEVALRVEALLFYGKPVPELHEGETAELALSGAGTQWLTAGVRLRANIDEGPG